VDVPDSNDLLNQITDLAVIDQLDSTGAASPHVTVMHGSAQRTLTAYYDPRAIFPPASAFDALVAGNFTSHAATDPTLDMLLFEVADPPPVPGGGPRPVNVWPIQGTSTAALLDPPTLPFTPCELALNDTTCPQALTVGDARFLPWSVGPHDVAIGVDLEGKVATIDPTSTPLTVTACTGCSLPVYDPNDMTSMQARGLLAATVTAARELYIAYGLADFRAPGGTVYSCQVSDQGVVTTCSDLVAMIPDIAAGWHCNDVASAPVTARGPFDPVPAGQGADLLLLCHDDGGNSVVWHVVHDAAGYHATQLLSQPDANVMVLADVTGDGVADLLLLGTSNQFPIFHVYPQCESRDQTCRDANTKK
jgi:hypothetical protein